MEYLEGGYSGLSTYSDLLGGLKTGNALTELMIIVTEMNASGVVTGIWGKPLTSYLT